MAGSPLLSNTLVYQVKWPVVEYDSRCQKIEAVA